MQSFCSANAEAKILLFDKLRQVKSYQHYLKISFFLTRETSIFEEQIMDWNAIEIQTQY